MPSVLTRLPLSLAVCAVFSSQAWAVCSSPMPVNTVCTTEDVAVAVQLADLGAAPSGATQVTFTQATTGSRIEFNGAPLDPTPVQLSAFSAGQVVWRPAPDNSDSNNGDGSTPPTVQAQFLNAAGTALGAPVTLKLRIANVNKPPQINGNLIVNGNFAARPNPDVVTQIPGWTLSGQVQYAYGGMAFNSGNPGVMDGVGSQQFVTQAGTLYKGSLRTTFGGGAADSRQSLDVVFTDVATGTELNRLNVQALQSPSFSFTASGDNTRVEVIDKSTYDYNVDIALSSIAVDGPMVAQTTAEDSALQWPAQAGIVIFDPDGPPTAAYDHVLTLTVSHGSLTLGPPASNTASYDHQADGLRATVSGSGKTFSVVGNPAGINYVLRGLGYTPDPNFNGSDTLTLVLNDQGNVGSGGALSATQTVPITVTPVNDPPTGQDNAASTRKDAPYSFKPADFSTGFADPVDAVGASGANAFAGLLLTSLPTGSLTLAGTPVSLGQSISVADLTAGSLVWTPPAGASGAPLTSFGFRVRDDGGTANGGVDLAVAANQMRLTVTPNANTPPVAVNDDYSTDSATPVNLAPLANDSDADGDALRITELGGVALTPGTAQTIAVPNGTVDVDAQGALRFTPAAGFVGTAQFAYAVADAYGGTASAAISVQVNAPPVVTPPAAPMPVPVNGAALLTLLGALLATVGAWVRGRRKV